MVVMDLIKSDLKYFLTQYNGHRIRKGEKPISLRQLARDTGISTSTLIALTTDKAKGIQFDTLSTLCAYFQCSPSDILRFTPDPPEE